MKIGMNLLLWGAHFTSEHYPILGRLKKMGYDGVEVPILAGTPEEYRELGKVTRDLGLETTGVSFLTAGASAISADAAERQAAVDRLKWVIDRGVDCGAKLLCGPIHSPLSVFSGAGPSKDEYQHGVETLRIVADYAAKAGVELAVEYLERFDSYFLTNAAEMYAWVEEIDRPSCGLMWDTFHAHIEEKNATSAIEAVRKRLIHVHLSENDRGTPGTGQVNWKDTFQTLRKIGYDRWLVIEAFGRPNPEFAAATRIWRDIFPDPEGLCREGLAFVRSQFTA